MEKTEATFNEIPQALDSILVRMEKLEGMISDIHSIHKRQTEAATPPPDLHVPMNIDDMVAFSHMKKSTVYYHIDNNGLLVSRSARTSPSSRTRSSCGWSPTEKEFHLKR